jgi:hypothetical protein
VTSFAHHPNNPMITYEQALNIVTRCLSAVGITVTSDDDLIQQALIDLHDHDEVASQRLYQCIYSRVKELTGYCSLSPSFITHPDYEKVKALAVYTQASSE